MTAKVASPSGSTKTIPFLPGSDAGPHGRVGGGSTLLWPGGPLDSPGHGGRGFVVWETGAAVGAEVGLGVGFAVGFGVGSRVGLGVAAGPAGIVEGVVMPVTGSGVGDGFTATIGPSLGVAVGSTEGSPDGSTEGSSAGSEAPALGVPELALGVVPEVALGAGSEPTGDAVETGAEVWDARATSAGGRTGATAPAVSATVARMRFNTPMATTSRAR